MDISIKHGTPGKQKTACFIAAVYSGKNLGDAAGALDKSSRQALRRLVKRGDLTGKLAETLFVPNAAGLAADRVLLVGAGKRSGISAADYLKLVTKVATAVVESGLKNALSALTEIAVDGRDDAWKIRQQITAFEGAAYRFDEYKTLPKRDRKSVV